MAPKYSYSFGRETVDKLFQAYPRASEFVSAILPRAHEHLVRFVREDYKLQVEWPKAKRFVKNIDWVIEHAPPTELAKGFLWIPGSPWPTCGPLTSLNSSQVLAAVAETEVILVNVAFLARRFPLTGGFWEIMLREQVLIGGTPSISLRSAAVLSWIHRRYGQLRTHDVNYQLGFSEGFGLDQGNGT